jgi:hypothetical protein
MRRIAKRLSAWIRSAIFVHNAAQALPWLVGITIATSLGAYAWIESRPFLFTVAVGVIAAGLIVLGLGFASWFLNRRRHGWRQRAEAAEDVLNESIAARYRAEGEAKAEAARRERSDLANDLVKGLNLWSLRISDSSSADEETSHWISDVMQPALTELMPTAGLGLVSWREGTYRLLCGTRVPKLIRALLPKRSSRHMGECLRRLGIGDEVHRINLSEDMLSPMGLEWLLCFRNESTLDEPAEAVLAAGARIIADARRGIGTSDVSPVPA